MPDCCSRLEQQVRDLTFDLENVRRLLDAHVEVQVMHQRGFVLRCSEVGRDVWASGSETVPAEHTFVRAALWAVNEAFARPEVPSVS